MLWGKKNPTDGSDKAWTTPQSPLFLWRLSLLPPLRYHLWPSEPVASRVHVVHGPKQKTLGIPFSLAANFWRVLSACKLRAVISGVCTWSRRRSRSQCWSWSRSLSDHCILILICTFLRASGSCLALSCRDLSSPAAYVRGLQTSCLLSLSLSFTHSLPLIIRQLTVYIVAGYARSDCSVIRQGLR